MTENFDAHEVEKNLVVRTLPRIDAKLACARRVTWSGVNRLRIAHAPRPQQQQKQQANPPIADVRPGESRDA